jgi:cytidine deaminase
MCARHIVAAGIAKVVYIEPYPKSLAQELYSTEIRVDDEGPQDPAVVFEPFVGVSPRKYLSLFRMRARKVQASGVALKWDPTAAVPRFQTAVSTYPDLETAAVDLLGASRPKWN